MVSSPARPNRASAPSLALDEVGAVGGKRLAGNRVGTVDPIGIAGADDHRGGRGEHHVVVVAAAMVGNGEGAVVDEQVGAPLGEVLEGAKHGIMAVVGDDLEFVADRRLEAADQGSVENGAAEIDGALDCHLVVGDASKAVADDLDDEAGRGVELEIAGVQHARAGAGGECPAAVDLGGTDRAGAAEGGAGLDGSGRRPDRSVVDLQQAGRHGDAAREIGVVTRDEKRAVAVLGDRALAGDGIAAGNRRAGSARDGERHHRVGGLQEHHRALRLAVGCTARVVTSDAAGYGIGAGEPAVIHDQRAAIGDEDGAAERRAATAVGADTRAAVAAEAAEEVVAAAAVAAAAEAAPPTGSLGRCAATTAAAPESPKTGGGQIFDATAAAAELTGQAARAVTHRHHHRRRRGRPDYPRRQVRSRHRRRQSPRPPPPDPSPPPPPPAPPPPPSDALA